MPKHESIFCDCSDCKKGYPVKLAEREGDEIVIKRTKNKSTHEIRIGVNENADDNRRAR